jgi:hypothetical protein
MHLKRSLFLFVFLVLSFYPTNLKAQKYISATGGLSVGSLFDFRKNDYNYSSDYKIKSGYFTYVSFDSLNEKQNLHLGLQIGSQTIAFESSQGSKIGPSTGSYNFNLQYIQIDFDFLFPIKSEKKYIFSLFFGPTLSYNFRTVMNGFGGYSKPQIFIDSLGIEHQSWSYNNWEETNRKSSRFSSINFGLNLGFKICYPFKDKIDFVFENKYTAFIYQKTNVDDYELNSFIRGDLSFGLRFKL